MKFIDSLLRRVRSRGIEPKPEKAVPVPTPGEAAPSSPPRALKKTVPSWTASGLLLYQNLSAPHSARPALTELRLQIQDGKPELYCLLASQGGQSHAEGSSRQWTLPKDMRDGLTVDTLIAWIKECLTPIAQWTGELPDEAWAKASSIRTWCLDVRALPFLTPPAPLIMVENPFAPLLEDVGPDGLSDDSGVALWLRLQEGASLREAVPALHGFLDRLSACDPEVIGWVYGVHWHSARSAYRFVILLDDAVLPDGLDLADLERPEEGREIWLARLQTPDVLLNLVTGQAYRCQSREWPGSADDAATYGEWWLAKTQSTNTGNQHD